jgi:hypothetical protein
MFSFLAIKLIGFAVDNRGNWTRVRKFVARLRIAWLLGSGSRQGADQEPSAQDAGRAQRRRELARGLLRQKLLL